MTLTSRVPAESVRRPLAIVAGLALALALLPLAGAAQAQDPPPNAPCPDGTPESEFIDRQTARAAHLLSIDCVAFHAISVGSSDAEGNPVYLPAGIVNRAQMATFIANTLEAAGFELPENGDDEFTDISGTVHRERINALARAGIVSGRTADLYRPGLPVTRAQMATFIVQAAEWAFEIDLEADDGPWFEDTIGTTHEANIDAGFEYGLFDGRVAPTEDTLGLYDPTSGTRRDQMATFLSRLLDFLWIDQGIVGLVVDAEDDEPIAGADVTITDDQDDVIAELTTGERGLFLAELDEGTYSVTAEAEGYQDLTVEDVEVEEDEITELVLALTGITGTITVTVTDEDDEPFVGAAVTVTDADDDGIAQETTGEDGEAVFTLAPGTYTVTATATDFLDATEVVELEGDEEEEVTLVLAPAFVEPFDVTLTADRELAPASEEANPGNDFPTRGDINFVLAIEDDEGETLPTTGRDYTFEVENTGDSAVVVACVRCAAPTTVTIEADASHTFEAPDRERVRIDADGPAEVEVTASTTVAGQPVDAGPVTATWVEVDEEPTGAGEAAAFAGTVAAAATDANWYLIDDEDDGYVFVEYETEDATDAYLIEGDVVDLAAFEAALLVGASVAYTTDADDAQTHDLTPDDNGNDNGND